MYGFSIHDNGSYNLVSKKINLIYFNFIHNSNYIQMYRIEIL